MCRQVVGRPGREVTEVRSHEIVRLGGYGRSQDVAVVAIRNIESVDEVFVVDDERIGYRHSHEVTSTVKVSTLSRGPDSDRTSAPDDLAIGIPVGTRVTSLTTEMPQRLGGSLQMHRCPGSAIHPGRRTITGVVRDTDARTRRR